MKDHGVDEERLEIMRTDTSQVRFRPSEVAASATLTPPVSFPQIETIVSGIEDRLRLLVLGG